ncbi:contractile injection system protein, VgrG/Pvc8 family (plasmid) [Tistrella mobilis]|uniref:phage late control D family protein n=1 Tax=Tistrella mobilis TaxID=171437 RepID=UPI0035574826
MRPRWSISADGADITAHLADRLLYLSVTDEAGIKSDAVEIRLDDRDGRIAWPRTGAELSVSMGYAGALSPMGLYQVDQLHHEGPPATLTIKASAAAFKASLKVPRTQGRDGVTIGALVAEIAARHGLQPRVAPDLAGIVLARVDQTNESDLHLLTRIAKERDAIAKPAGGALVFAARGEGKSASGKVLRAVAVASTEVVSWSVDVAERGKVAAVIASWTDPDTGNRVPERVGAADGTTRTLRRTYSSPDEARSAARAALDASDRGAATLDLTIIGNPVVAAETRLTLTGIRPGIDGTWSVTRAEHRLDASGYQTSITAETPKTP